MTTLPIENVLFWAAVLLLASVLVSKISSRFGVPALLLFLAVGMLAGSEGIGGIEFEDAHLSQSLGVIALAFILFAGGLSTPWNDIRPVLRPGLLLATFGVVLTALIVALGAQAALGMTLREGLLLGAIVSSTDAAAVFAVLNAKGLALKGSLKPMLELESGSNDPMAVFLTISFTQLLTGETSSVWSLIPFFVQQMALGVALGYAISRAAVLLINRLQLEHGGLYPVLSVALVLFTYGLTASLGGSGFLAVYVAGLVLGNTRFVHKRSLLDFQDGLAWLMQIVMFLTLGLLVFPSRLLEVIPDGLLISALLMAVARPVSVFLSLLPFSTFDLREKTLIAWVGLRGAAPIILATFPLVAGLPQAGRLFDLVFFIVLTSVLLQGTFLGAVAKWLGVDAPTRSAPDFPIDFDPMQNIRSELAEVDITPGSRADGRRIVEVGIPEEVLIVLVGRDQEFIVPNGGTLLRAGDRLLVLADPPAIDSLRGMLGSA